MTFRCLATLFVALMAAGCQDPAPPNIVIILADDMGYSDIGAYGGEISTPNLDRLADDGLRFRQFYNAGRCCPTRASLLTGRYPHQVGMGAMVSSLGSDPTAGPYQGYLSDQSLTIAEALRPTGYRTYMSGKWHVGERPEHWPRQRGFDRYFGLISGASSYYEIIRDQPRVRQMVLDDDRWEPPAEGFYMTDAFTDSAVHFLEEHTQEAPSRPFFLYVAYTAPHWPLHAPAEDIERYLGRYDIGWDSLRAERHQRMRDLGIIDERYDLSPRPAELDAWANASNKEDWSLRMAVYAAMVDRMDQGIGRILEQLAAMNALQNTLLLFLADNGGCAESVEGRALHDSTKAPGERGSYVAYQEAWANASNTPFRLYKQWTHEGGIATPFIVHWPDGIARPGRIEGNPGHVIDLMSTVLEAARIDGLPTEGSSLIPVFESERAEIAPRTLYWEHIGNRAVREGNWKLVLNRRLGQWELYDLDDDPTELRDLAPLMPDEARRLEDLWHAWARRVGVFGGDG